MRRTRFKRIWIEMNDKKNAQISIDKKINLDLLLGIG